MPNGRGLVFDIGVGGGEDSAYYLYKGFQVVGVEANPVAVEGLRKRFRSEIDEGRYILVPIGIAEVDGQAGFWVCDDWAEWSSFHRDIASRAGARHHKVMVDTCRFRTLLERFGSPFYCKIDIEGNDHLCLEDIDRASAPKFISVEAGDGESEIRKLSEIGYTKFKVISQLSLRQMPLSLAKLKARLPIWGQRSVEKAQGRLWRHRSDGSWRFKSGASGPFNEASQGAWLSASEASERNQLFELGRGLLDWQDIHATH